MQELILFLVNEHVFKKSVKVNISVCRLAMCNSVTLRILKEFLDRYVWQKKLESIHDILLESRNRLKCVREGQHLLSYCGRSFIQFDKRINLEKFLKCQMMLRYYKENGSSCFHEYEGVTGEICIFDKKDELSQHTVSYWSSGVSRSDEEIKTKDFLNRKGYVCASRDPSKCQCYHCVTYKSTPNQDCQCPKCLDPINGKAYWISLSGYSW